MDYSSTEFINPSLRIIVLGIYCLLALYSKMRKMDGNCLGERSGQPVKYFFFLILEMKITFSLLHPIKNVFNGRAWVGWTALVNCGSLQISDYLLGLTLPLKECLPMPCSIFGCHSRRWAATGVQWYTPKMLHRIAPTKNQLFYAKCQ